MGIAVFFKSDGAAIAGFTLILIIITGWYARSTEKQYKISERLHKGRYIAEISRSIFSPMLYNLRNIKKRLEYGIFLNFDDGVKINLSYLESPEYFIHGDVQIIPEIQTIGVSGDLRRPARQLLNIEQHDEILKYSISSIEKLSASYSKRIMELQENYDYFLEGFPSILTNIKQECPSFHNTEFSEVLRNTNHTINYEDNLIRKICIDSLSNTRCYSHTDAIGQRIFIRGILEEGNIRISILNWNHFTDIESIDSEYYYPKIYLNFLLFEKGSIINYLKTTSLNEYTNNIINLQTELLELVNELITTIESLQLKWKTEYFLLKNELHERKWGSC